MNEIPLNSILKFNPNQLEEVRKEFGFQNSEQMNEAIDQLDDWIKKQNHFFVKDFDRTYLERYIISNKGSLERTKKRFDRLCTMRNLMPEFLRDFDIRNEFRLSLNCGGHCVLPKPCPDNYRIVAITIHNPEAHEDFSIMKYYRYVCVLCEYLFCHDYNAGYKTIVDMRNVNLHIIKKLNPIVLQKVLKLFTEGFGLRLKVIHVILSKSILFDTIMMILKQSFTEKLSKRLVVHVSFDTLYEHFSKETLPKDFGGEERSIKELTETIYEEFISGKHVERMKFIETVRTDESLRLSCHFNEEYSGMPGSFKSLCVD